MVNFKVYSREKRNIGDKKPYVRIWVVLGGVELLSIQAAEYGKTNQAAVDEMEEYLSKLRLALRKEGVNSTIERINA